jgi:aminoglycoside phosphotransferase (APT) family kinase protein
MRGSAAIGHATEPDEVSSFRATLLREGVLRSPHATLTPLCGGVSSEIYRVDDGGDVFVVKRALAKLKVKDEWTADVGRNHNEQLFISYVARFLPYSVPTLRTSPRDLGYFAMELLGPGFVNWKDKLLHSDACINDAECAASILATIHAHSAGDAEAARTFDTTAHFVQLRIDPYLLTTGRRHPDLSAIFESEAARLAATRQCLVHGDFSPKNFMLSPSRMVLLDCEVAWYGDPAFDLAFLLTHLHLKALHHAPRNLDFHSMCLAFWQRYVGEASSAIDAATLEPRVAHLLLMLLLARVDGKSPVEYLASAHQRDTVRAFARTGLLTGWSKLPEVFERWFDSLKEPQ